MKNKYHPTPAGIPIKSSNFKKKIFCQKCGQDIDNTDFKHSAGTDNMNFCKCGAAGFISNWVSIDSNIMHMMQGLNYLIVGEDSSIQSSPSKNLFYEL